MDAKTQIDDLLDRILEACDRAGGDLAQEIRTLIIWNREAA